MRGRPGAVTLLLAAQCVDSCSVRHCTTCSLTSITNCNLTATALHNSNEGCLRDLNLHKVPYAVNLQMNSQSWRHVVAS